MQVVQTSRMIRRRSQRGMICALAVATCLFACTPGKRPPAELSTTATASTDPCPEGAQLSMDELVGRFDAACLHSIVRWRFKFPDLSRDYDRPLFRIPTPSDPIQLAAYYSSRNDDGTLALQIDSWRHEASPGISDREMSVMGRALYYVGT